MCDLEVLQSAQNKIEEVIEKAKVKSKNTILAGVSEAADMAIWTALHTKYKLGAVFPIFPQYPSILNQKVPNNITNSETHILHIHHIEEKQEINGREILEKSFKNVELKAVGSSYQNNFFKALREVFENFEEKHFISFDFPCNMYVKGYLKQAS